jgi:alpha-beta hydrolase superfamily lysophospholipase
VAIAVLALAGCMPPAWGAGGLLHPGRRPITRLPTLPFQRVELIGDGLTLRGWRFAGQGPPRAVMVYLHGAGDNRSSSIGIAERYVPRGFEVLAYDSRAHGESDGDACTYGFHEKRDLARLLDTVTARPIVLVGTSLGAAVALQAAAQDQDHRIAAIVSIATFSDLRTVARERAPFFASRGNIEAAFRIAEATAHFRVDEVSPASAAARITAPVLIIHGDADVDTPPDHSRRVFAALPGAAKKLLMVPGGGHNDHLPPGIWREVDAWLDLVLPPATPPPPPR